MSAQPPDQEQRDQALHPSRSFIVQAPAGSGKTGLLIRRFLRLLATVEQPEQILAITFTRKATAEMRERIVDALAAANNPDLARKMVKKGDADIVELAWRALQRDHELGWNLSGNPGRLRVMTIDALCYELVRYMPWSARFGATPELLDQNQTELAWLEAAKQTLDLIEEGPPLADYCADLIKLARTDFNQARQLLSTMLSRRVHWMSGLRLDTRQQTEQMWQQVVERHLQQIASVIPDEIKRESVALARFAAAELAEQDMPRLLLENPEFPASKLVVNDPEHPLYACLGIETFPDTRFESVGQWLGIASLLLTDKGELRKRVDKRHGFPPKCPEKHRIEGLLRYIADIDEDSLIAATLHQVRLLPVAGMTDSHWQTLNSLLQILPVAAAQLRLLFKDRNQADFTEIAHRAQEALGAEDNPTDLALVMDHKLSHLLMDEVQDTSRTQIELVEKLTAGWQDGDGRTVFFVGDPQQSIYRFREADVANFQKIQKEGIGNVRPDSLTLESNFRSAPELVDWFNNTFQKVFPSEPDDLFGGVQYTEARSGCPEKTGGSCTIHPYREGEKIQGENAVQREAEMICQQVKEILQSNTETDKDRNIIGILGRTRNHLVGIAQALRQKGIRYQAVDLENLNERTPILDLIALTRALSQLGDRIAWLAVLRSPWCGLDLKDLSVIAMAESPTILQTCLAEPVMARMSAGGQRRIRRFTAAIQPMVNRHGRVSLRHNVEAAWLRLGGPACIDETDVPDCEVWLDLLDTLEAEHTLITPEILLKATEQLWSGTDVRKDVQLMTMHKAKGLEFDVVILPQLHRTGPSQDRELVRSIRYPDQLLLAGLPDAQEADPLYDYLGTLEEKQRENDNRRLLYVACTRARRELHLYGCITDGLPVRSSLLHLLWPSVSDEVGQIEIQQAMSANPDESAQPQQTGQTGQPQEAPHPLRPDADPFSLTRFPISLTRFQRLPQTWSMPEFPEDLALNTPEPTHNIAIGNEIEFSWAGETLRITGIAIHHILQQIDDRNWREWKSRKTGEIVDSGRVILVEHGLDGAKLESACDSLKTAVENIQSDPMAEWIFSSDHSRIRTEWSLTGRVDHTLARVVIDRTFVDQDGTRWIIDFKSGRHEGGDRRHFLEQEKQRYHSQMARYAQIMHNLEDNRIKLGLYFPLLKEWLQWET